MYRTLRPFAFSVLCLAASMCSSSCGIDTYEYLSNKAVSKAGTDGGFQFLGPEADSENYYGQFIYYKIYAAESSAISEYSYIVTKQNENNAVPGAVAQSQLMSSSGYGYQKLALHSSAAGTTLPIPTLQKSTLSAGYLASVSFPASQAEPILTVSDEATGAETASYTIVRSVSSSSGTYLSFWDVPVSGQADYKTGTVTGNTYYVQFFAVAYGLKSDLADLYGDAVYLGRVTLRF